ncbi:MAG: hypothetical protein WD361_12600 [Gracilimonas sp.]
MKKLLPHLSLLLFLMCAAHPILCTQEQKQEVERSITKNEMFAKALSILNQFWNDEKKVDFYREFDGQSVSYEAKFKLRIKKSWELLKFCLMIMDNPSGNVKL